VHVFVDHSIATAIFNNRTAVTRRRDPRDDGAQGSIGTDAQLQRTRLGRAEIKPDRADVAVPWESRAGHTKTSVTESSASFVGVSEGSLW
jgi:hypothetical protein